MKIIIERGSSKIKYEEYCATWGDLGCYACGKVIPVGANYYQSDWEGKYFCGMGCIEKHLEEVNETLEKEVSLNRVSLLLVVTAAACATCLRNLPQEHPEAWKYALSILKGLDSGKYSLKEKKCK